MEQIRQDVQVNRNTDDRTLHTKRTVPSGHARRVLYNLRGMLEPKYYCRADISLAVLWAPSFALGHGSLLKLMTITMVQKETRIMHSNGRGVTMLPAPFMAVDQHPGPPHRLPRRDGT